MTPRTYPIHAGSIRHRVLKALARRGSGTSAEMVRATKLSSRQASAALAGLARSGHATREPSDKPDRFRFAITAQGRAALKHVKDHDCLSGEKMRPRAVDQDRVRVEAFWRKRRAELAEIQRGWDQ